MLKVCIRVDDVGWGSESIEPWPHKKLDVGLRLAQQFHAAMQGLPYLGAVIPKALDKEGLAWLHSQPCGFTGAVHGYCHDAPNRVCDEFLRLEFAEIRRRVSYARDYCCLPYRHFVSPFNTYTDTLTDALVAEGFRYLWMGPVDRRYLPMRCFDDYNGPLPTLIPAWLPLYGCSCARMQSTERPLLDVWPGIKDEEGRAVLTLHLPWELAKNPSFDGLKNLVDMIHDHVMSPEEYIGDL